jgi:hypothetical protein
MSMCVYFVFVLSCVQVAALQRADPPSKESYRLCKTYQGTANAAKFQQRGIGTGIDRYISFQRPRKYIMRGKNFLTQYGKD